LRELQGAALTDVFISYSSDDRARVKPVHDALAQLGFSVFWDQSLPAGQNWDTEIRQNLRSARAVVVFWSKTSVASPNVFHEAVVARDNKKLIPVLLEPLTSDQFPTGLYSAQAVNFAGWTGGEDIAWIKFQSEIETRVMPPWVARLFDQKDAAILAEKARREAAERRESGLKVQLAKEAEELADAERERDAAKAEAAKLETRLKEEMHDRARLKKELEAKQAEAEAAAKAAQNLDAERKALQARLDDARKRLQDATTANTKLLDEYHANQARLQQLDGQIKETQSKTMANARAEVAREKQALEATIAEQQRVLTHAAKQIEKLRHAESDLRQRLADAHLTIGAYESASTEEERQQITKAAQKASAASRTVDPPPPTTSRPTRLARLAGGAMETIRSRASLFVSLAILSPFLFMFAMGVFGTQDDSSRRLQAEISIVERDLQLLLDEYDRQNLDLRSLRDLLEEKKKLVASRNRKQPPRGDTTGSERPPEPGPTTRAAERERQAAEATAAEIEAPSSRIARGEMGSRDHQTKIAALRDQLYLLKLEHARRESAKHP
jgi:hypothetical protein